MKTVDFEAVIHITSSNEKLFESGVKSLIDNFQNVTLFFIVQVVLIWFSGRACKTIIRELKIDLKFKIFRFRNKWHYILRGEIIHFPENTLNSIDIGKIDYTWVDVLVNPDSNGSMLYSGLLSDYHLTDKGVGLEHIELISVRKKSANIKSKSKSVSSDTLIIPYDSIQNINLTYVEDEEKKNSREAKKQRKLKRRSNIILLLILGLLPLFFFRFKLFNFQYYNAYFDLGFWFHLFSFILFGQLIGLFMPIENEDRLYSTQRGKLIWFVNILIVISVVFILYLLAQ